MRLQKQQRLLAPQEFRQVYASEYWGSTRCYSFNALPADRTKIGVTVSKKVAKSAVVRNRIKRQVREYYRLNQRQLEGTHLVITARASCANVDDAERYKSLEELWRKVLKWRRWYTRKYG